MAELMEKSEERLLDTTRQGKREAFPPVLEPVTREEPTLPALPRVSAGYLRFVPAPADQPDKPAPPPRRVSRMNWGERLFEASWMTMLLACAAECVYRLLWAIQP